MCTTHDYESDIDDDDGDDADNDTPPTRPNVSEKHALKWGEQLTTHEYFQCNN